MYIHIHKNIYFRYDCIDQCVPDAFSHLFEETHHLETELGHLPQKWKVLWDKLEVNTSDSLSVSDIRNVKCLIR